MTRHLGSHPSINKPPGNRSVELMPGDVALGYRGDSFRTLLGSCVSVILSDPRRTVGCMCHIVHVGTGSISQTGNTAYGEHAMSDMFSRLREVGLSHRFCEAYVYGGGNMFPHLIAERHVGASNGEWVMDYLAHHHIAVLDHELGGHGYRKISWVVGPDDPIVETVMVEPRNISHAR